MDCENEKLKAKTGELTMTIDLLKNGKLEKPAQRREFVDHHLKGFGSISAACEAVGLSISSYYYKPNGNPVRANADARTSLRRSRQSSLSTDIGGFTNGSRRSTGNTINEKRILRIMRELGLKALIWRGFKVKTTDSNYHHGYAPNRLPVTKITDINQVWVTDLT